MLLVWARQGSIGPASKGPLHLCGQTLADVGYRGMAGGSEMNESLSKDPEDVLDPSCRCNSAAVLHL